MRTDEDDKEEEEARQAKGSREGEDGAGEWRI
jgi:hypothetical protein